MKKICFFLCYIIISVLIFVSCSKKDTNDHKDKKDEIANYNFTYIGECDLWSAEYNVDETVKYPGKDNKSDVETYATNDLVVKYKGKSDLSSAKSIEITYGSSNLGPYKYYDDGGFYSNTFTIDSTTKNFPRHSENDIFTVTIKLDESTQSFKLENKQ